MKKAIKSFLIGALAIPCGIIMAACDKKPTTPQGDGGMTINATQAITTLSTITTTNTTWPGVTVDMSMTSIEEDMTIAVEGNVQLVSEKVRAALTMKTDFMQDIHAFLDDTTFYMSYGEHIKTVCDTESTDIGTDLYTTFGEFIPTITTYATNDMLAASIQQITALSVSQPNLTLKLYENDGTKTIKLESTNSMGDTDWSYKEETSLSLTFTTTALTEIAVDVDSYFDNIKSLETSIVVKPYEGAALIVPNAADYKPMPASIYDKDAFLTSIEDYTTDLAKRNISITGIYDSVEYTVNMNCELNGTDITAAGTVTLGTVEYNVYITNGYIYATDGTNKYRLQLTALETNADQLQLYGVLNAVLSYSTADMQDLIPDTTDPDFMGSIMQYIDGTNSTIYFDNLYDIAIVEVQDTVAVSYTFDNVSRDQDNFSISVTKYTGEITLPQGLDENYAN